MAHNISNVSGRYETFYAGKVPWHGLGVRLPDLATSEQAIQAAGIDYTVETQPVVTEGGIAIPQAKAVIRTDANVSLGVVGNRYQLIQNREAFGFFDSIVGEGKAIYETAGALGKGERVWILAKLPGDLVIENDVQDTTEKYLLFINSHDGTSACRMFYTPVRVVCQNTLNMALSGREAAESVSIRHSGNVQAKVVEARRILGLANAHYQKLEEQANWLASLPMDSVLFKGYLDALYPIADDVTDRVRKNVVEERGNITAIFERERGRSRWHAANAVIEHVDHHKRFRGDTDRKVLEGRFKNVLMGVGAEAKRRAFAVANSL